MQVGRAGLRQSGHRARRSSPLRAGQSSPKAKSVALERSLQLVAPLFNAILCHSLRRRNVLLANLSPTRLLRHRQLSHAPVGSEPCGARERGHRLVREVDVLRVVSAAARLAIQTLFGWTFPAWLDVRCKGHWRRLARGHREHIGLSPGDWHRPALIWYRHSQRRCSASSFLHHDVHVSSHPPWCIDRHPGVIGRLIDRHSVRQPHLLAT